jgi:RNA polymerase sigma-70 factor (ECF subfamily)
MCLLLAMALHEGKPVPTLDRVAECDEEREIYMARRNVRQPEPSMGFEEQVAPHLQALSALAWRFTHNTAMAQDLLQDTLIKAYRFFDRFEIGTNLWAWLLTIMRNLYISQVRKRSRGEVLVDMDRLPLLSEHSVVVEPEVPQPEDLCAALQYLVADEVLQALDNIPEDYRMTVLLADLMEYSYKEIAASMDCPIGTVMSRLHRGRHMLQNHLQQYAVDQGYIHSEYLSAAYRN